MVVTLAAPGTYTVQVNNPDGGKSANGAFNVSVSAPAISAISPSGLAATLGSQTLTLSGSGFQAGLVVTLGLPGGGSLTIPGAQVGSVSAVSFQVVAIFALPGTYTLQVSNPDGGKSNVASFQVSAGAPAITSVAPQNPAIGNQVLTVTGSGFEPGLTVTLGLPGGGFSTISGVQIGSVTAGSFQVAVTLAAAGAYTLQVNNPDGGKSSPFTFGVATAPDIADGGVVNGASFLPGIASSGWVTIKGTALSLTTRQWSQSDFAGNLLPNELDGVSVAIDGLPAYVYFVSPAQLNVLAPDDPTVGQVAVVVKNSLGTSNTATASKASRAPAFFILSGSYPAAVHANGALVGPAGLIPGVTSTPAKPGETIVLFGTGFGDTNPPLPAGQLVTQPADLTLPVTVLVGGLAANVSYAGRTGSGLDQLNVQIPGALTDGDATLVAQIGGLQTQGGVLLSVRQSAAQAK